MNHLVKRVISSFSTITYLRGKPQHVETSRVKLRGIKIASTKQDSPNLIFFPQIFDKAQNWLSFFTNPNNKILDERNVWILYPRNFGTSDHTAEFNWQEMADDVARFMYEHQISMATFGGHGLGGKIALACASYNLNKATGYFGIASSPMNQYYFEAARQVRNYVETLQHLNLHRGFPSIVGDLKQNIHCPKWRSLFQNNLVKGDASYRWEFNVKAVAHNLLSNTPNSLWEWPTLNGLFTGKAMFAFPEYSRWVHLGTNTLPMLKVCPQLHGFNQGISYVQGDENPQNHWVYESEEQVNTYASRIANFVRHYDGVNVLLKNREEVGQTFLPDLNLARVEKEDFAGDKQPAHYYHNWRFNNPY